VEEDIHPDVVFARLTPPDANGMCSYGWAPGYTPDLVRLAKERGLPLVAEIDPTMPFMFSNEQVPLEAITCTIECSGPPEGGDVPVLASEKSGAIAVHLNPLVPDGATLQVGIGSVPDAAVGLLVDKKDLGVHTEVLNEGLIDLIEGGQATGPGKRSTPARQCARSRPCRRR
jgi:4-hydroxybutyrate CoA-transferase